MVIDFISQYAKLIVNNPDDIKISLKILENNVSEITIQVHKSDIGKLIGKNGNMINAIKTIVNGCKAKNSISYKIKVISF
jgi:predicted RNA-binding protein YlqC (UPF0109 family)